MTEILARKKIVLLIELFISDVMITRGSIVGTSLIYKNVSRARTYNTLRIVKIGHSVAIKYIYIPDLIKFHNACRMHKVVALRSRITGATNTFISELVKELLIEPAAPFSPITNRCASCASLLRVERRRFTISMFVLVDAASFHTRVKRVLPA